MAGKINVLLLGAGKIGGAIVEYLAGSGDYLVAVADQDELALRLMAREDVGRMQVNVTDASALAKAVSGTNMVLSALPFYLNAAVAEAARNAGAHYFDLTEDVETTRAVRRIAVGAEHRVRAAMRARTGLYFYCRLRSHQEIRQPSQRPYARGSAAAVPDKRPQI